MNNKITALIVVLVVIVAGWLIYRHNGVDVSNYNPSDMTVPAGSGANVDAADNPISTSTPATDDSTSATANVKEFTVTAGSFYFSPKTLSVNKGDTVKINFVNSGGMHDWRLDEFNAKTPVLQSGQSASITFVADKSGTFEYYCSVGTHRQMGMVGTLTVK